jgi:hypothetical protein
MPTKTSFLFHRSQILVQPGQDLLDVFGPWRDVVSLVEDEAFVLWWRPKKVANMGCDEVLGGKMTSYLPFSMRVGVRTRLT